MPSISDDLAIALGHHNAGRFAQAEAICRNALRTEAGHADALGLLAGVLLKQGRFDEAAASYRRVLELRPQNAGAQFYLASALRAQGHRDEAVAAYRRAVEIKPDFAEAYFNIASILLAREEWDEAADACRRAIDLRPEYVEAIGTLGLALKALGRLDEAVAAFHRTLELSPDLVPSHSNLAMTLHALGRYDEALEAGRTAVRIKPDQPQALTNLGLALEALGRLDEAVAAHRRALELDESFPEANYNLGNALQEQNKTREAVAAFRRAIEFNPDYANAHANLGMGLLRLGELPEGFDEYEWRWKVPTWPSPPRSFAQPLWDGRPLEGRRILLHTEQGLGDNIQFVRYAPQIQALGGRVILACPPRLRRLLQTMAGIDLIVTDVGPTVEFDVHAPLLSLPRILGTTIGEVPADAPYLSAESALVAAWRERLGPRRGFRVGITWQGNPQFKDDDTRSIPLACFVPMARLPGVEIFCLQKEYGREQLAELPDDVSIADLGPELHDLADTAAVMMNLDLVITSCTSIAHLAGALARPTWVALELVPCWRWLMDREDCPWYPSMRLFRQPERGAWKDVFRRIEAGLASLAGS